MKKLPYEWKQINININIKNDVASLGWCQTQPPTELVHETPEPPKFPNLWVQKNEEKQKDPALKLQLLVMVPVVALAAMAAAVFARY